MEMETNRVHREERQSRLMTRPTNNEPNDGDDHFLLLIRCTTITLHKCTIATGQTINLYNRGPFLSR
jgi:hypothetical protein